MILIDIRGSRAVVRKQEILTTGMVGATVKFCFDARWKDLSKTAVFRSGDVVKDVVVLDSTAIIPHEVLVENGYFLEIGVYGTSADGKVVIPTIYARTNQIKEGTDPSGDESIEPTPGVYEQIMVELSTIRAENKMFTEEVRQTIDDATKRNIANIEKTGTNGLIDTYTITFLDGSTQNYTVTNGEKGDDYVLTDSDKQDIADIVVTTEEFTKLQQDIDNLKYVPIDITGISNNCGAKEMGTVVNEVTVSWTLNKEPASQTLDGEAVEVSARSKAFAGLNITANKSFTLSVTDERGSTDSASTSVSFLNGVYYGVLESGVAIDSAAILALTKKLQGSKGIAFTADAGATQRIVYAIPTRYGTPNFNVGGFDGGFAKAKTFSFTNASGYTESYDVWLSENVGLGSTTVKVS